MINKICICNKIYMRLKIPFLVQELKPHKQGIGSTTVPKPKAFLN